MAFSVIPSTNISILKGNRILLSRRKNTGWMDGHLCIPGGHVEPGETPRQAAVRELKEELGLIVKENELMFICVAARNTNPSQYVAFEFVLKGDNYKYKNEEPSKCSELIWVDVNNLPDDVISDFRQIIEDGIVKGNKYLEVGF